VSANTSRGHYSYSVYADPDVARTFEMRRFGGPIGELVANDQARVLLEFIGDPDGRQVLDVGTGTGRAARLLAARGAQVTGVDASEEMLMMARRAAADEQLDIRFELGDAHSLDFEDRTFDTVISLRVLMHAPDWRRCLSELCRVADRRVVIDFPAALSFSWMQSKVRRFTHTWGFRTEPYRVFRDRVIADELAASGFRIQRVHRHFTLPIALHKRIGSPGFTKRSEAFLDRLGLRRLIGSPVTLAAERCASS
jgi:ubiquinone/menaquinone biosynthesis C-methylase UbiE